MKVSVIIPVYNGEKYLDEALRSVFGQEKTLLQEVIVVDDGSTDETEAVVKRYGSSVKYLYQNNQGVGAARNVGIKESQGPYIAFLDADDIWVPNKLRCQVEQLERGSCDMVFGHVSHFKCSHASGSFTKSFDPMPGRFALTLLAKKIIFEKVGGFSESLRVGEFIDWYSRALADGFRDLLLDEVLAYRRVHDKNMTIEQRPHYGDYAKVLKKHLERSRGYV